MEATGSDGLVIDSNIDNTGNIWANGSDVTIHGDVTGSGTATINGAATLELDGASHIRVTFADDAAQTLTLDEGDDFAGTVAGLGEGDSFDFTSLGSAGNATFSYTEDDDGKGGRLTASDGVESISIELVGNYDSADFTSENRESNLPPILREKHKGKTARDVDEKAKVARVRAKHLGLWPNSHFEIPRRARPHWADDRRGFCLELGDGRPLEQGQVPPPSVDAKRQ